MSDASKCDRCGVFFEAEPGTVSLDVRINTKDDGAADGWTDIDLCKPCGKLVVALIAPALNDLDPKLMA